MQRRIVLLGPPGTGKGTQAARLCLSLKIPHLATGDLLRSAMKRDTLIGRLVRPFMDTGNLVPDDIVITMLKEAMGPLQGYLLDGFPRTVAQAESLKDAINKVILIDTPAEVIEKRLSARRICSQCPAVYNLDSNPPTKDGICDGCASALIQRIDDMPETIQTRQRRYWQDTAPLIDYYKKAKILWTIDGGLPMETVTVGIMAAVETENG